MIELPYPPNGCWPNRAVRMHWRTKGADKKRARADATWTMKGYIASLRGETGKAPGRLCFTVHPKTRRAPDRDNCVAAMKAYQDGICDALGIDDATLDTPKIIIGEPRKGGAVIVEVE